MPRPMILACQLSDARLAKLRFLCMKQGLLLKAIPVEDFAQPVGALCGLMNRVESPEPAAPFDGEMIVFCHMDNAAVHRFLQVARQQRIPPFALKAMLTPTNAAWNLSGLYEELRQEHEAVSRGEAAHDQSE